MPNPSPHADKGTDLAALTRVVEPIVRAHGAEVVDLELRPERGGWILRVYVEKAGASENGLSTRDAAVNLELCANVSRDLSPALDVADLIAHAYELEVSSPGVERPLKTPRDYTRFVGQKVKLRLRDPVDGQRVVLGILQGMSDDGQVRVAEGSRTIDVPLARIERARLVFELFAQPKGGAHPKKNGSRGKEPSQR